MREVIRRHRVDEGGHQGTLGRTNFAPHAKQKQLDGVQSEGEGGEGDDADGYDGYGKGDGKGDGKGYEGKGYDGDGTAGCKGAVLGVYDGEGSGNSNSLSEAS